MAQSNSVKNWAAHRQLAAIRANDEAALKSLYQNNFRKVETFILNNSGTDEQAKDIYQDAFIAVWRNVQLDKFQPENETALDGYLYQVAKNKWMDYLRSGHHNKVVPMNRNLPDHSVEMPEPDEDSYIDKVKEHIEGLGPNCRELLEKFYYGNQSLKQIAESMGWTEATARNNKYRCIQRLRELLNPKKR